MSDTIKGRPAQHDAAVPEGRIRERFILHQWRIEGSRRSRIAPEVTHCVDAGVRCPYCKNPSAIPEHGTTLDHECGASLTVFGNSLYVEIDEANARSAVTVPVMVPVKSTVN